MNKLKIGWFLLFAIVIFSAQGFTLPPQQHVRVNDAIEKMLSCQFDAALSQCDSIILIDQDDPLGWMLRLSVFALRDLDIDYPFDTLQYFGTYKKVQNLVAAYKVKHGANSYAFTIEGFSKGVTAAYCLQQKMYMRGLDIGFDALALLKEAKKLDERNNDADFFLGMYAYARAELKQKFWWAFFWYPGDKKDGIQDLYICKKNSEMSKLFSTLLLAEIVTKEKRYSEANVLVCELEKQCPTSRFVMWTHAKLYEAQQLKLEAADLYGILAHQYDTIPSAQKNAILTRWKQSVLYNEIGKTKRARENCLLLLKKKLSSHDAASKEILHEASQLLKTIDSKK